MKTYDTRLAEAGAQEERDAVVAHLRERADRQGRNDAARRALHAAADDIEKGDHRRMMEALG